MYLLYFYVIDLIVYIYGSSENYKNKNNIYDLRFIEKLKFSLICFYLLLTVMTAFHNTFHINTQRFVLKSFIIFMWKRKRFPLSVHFHFETKFFPKFSQNISTISSSRFTKRNKWTFSPQSKQSRSKFTPTYKCIHIFCWKTMWLCRVVYNTVLFVYTT